MLSRLQLREIAWQKLRAAATLLEAGDWDTATHVCGVAVELILKARICVDKQLPGWPESDGEFRSLAPLRLRSHSLDHLLDLTNHASHIRANFGADWGRCLQWRVETRYQPAGTSTGGSAKALHGSAETIIRALNEEPGLEVVPKTHLPFAKLRTVEQELAIEHGGFSLFAIWHREGTHAALDLVISAPWIDPDLPGDTEVVVQRLKAMLTPEEHAQLAGLFFLRGDHLAVKAAFSLAKMEHAQLRVENFAWGPADERYFVDSATFITVRDRSK